MNFAEKILNLRTEYGYSQETLDTITQIISEIKQKINMQQQTQVARIAHPNRLILKTILHIIDETV